MKNKREKWTDEDHHLLKKIVLEHVQLGATKTAAFKKAASLLGRTPAACSHRWNHVLCKEEKTSSTPTAQLQLPAPEKSAPPASDPLTLDTVVQFLQALAQEESHAALTEEHKKLKAEQVALKNKAAALKKLYNEKKEQNQKLTRQYETIARILSETESLLGEHIVH
ncbi:Myb-like DNA-binding domain-containing protein [Robertmurraya sp. DFI.2.37]|uniref:Myb-like DNA-binding domain-containing protein n=1 Tax=Robertmurraya sp. DFI.2.37 TaxID=3031819 RepID=UPI0012487965|nr:Myb-like DNA-binding domain-containing protein [Robertmurraya sp. DFI.2.37]MDF1510640.1 Myb-like DNA-binding domain-containing protein [Robertmurraya sp. DFI.2.37]